MQVKPYAHVLEPLWPDDLLHTWRVISYLTYHTWTHCGNHKHDLQQSHISISVMSSVHHLSFWLGREHFLLQFMCILWYNSLPHFGKLHLASQGSDWCQCLDTTFKEVMNRTISEMSCCMDYRLDVHESSTAGMWKRTVLVCVHIRPYVHIRPCVCVPVQSQTAWVCSISTNTLFSHD